MSGKIKRSLSPEEKGFFYLGLFAVSILLSSILPQPALARTWYIKADGTGDAPTIQAGVDSAAAGDTVLVGGGMYSDTTHVKIYSSPVPVNVHLNKNIVLAGETPGPDVVINGALSATAIFVHDVDSTTFIRSIKIRRADPTIYCPLDSRSGLFEVPSQHEDAGILCRDSFARIEENELVDLGYGVKIEGGSPSVRNNVFLRTFAGVSATRSTTAEITGNRFDTFYVAVGGSGCSPRIIGNEIIGNPNSCEGISFFDAALFVSHNVIRDTEYNGITLQVYQATSQAIIENNWFEGVSWTALSLGYCHQTTVRGNTFSRNSIAIEIPGSTDVVLENNTIDGAGIGMVAQLYGNSFIRRNIVTRATDGIVCPSGSSAAIECNNVFGVTRRYSGCSDQTGMNGNISVDPEYCGIDDSGNYFLQSDSPCAPGNHPYGFICGLIGAHGVNCGKVGAAGKSWGAIKSLYQKEEGRDQ